MSTTIERSESVDNTCPVCHDVIEIYAVGPCDHRVCYRCSTRMRVLCEQMDCPICRSHMPQVAFVYEKISFRDISLRKCIPNSKYKIFYEDKEVEDRFLELLEFRCKMPACKNRNSERSFSQLQTHMRREHQLFACDLCVSHLKIFPFERKFYNRKYLAIHRRIGDEDDRSYKGHPLCEFCDSRYNDKDELLKHLRKDHFFCHFCDQHGSNAYYDQYPDLMKHFSESHFLCTEGECGNGSTRFTHAFASEIDLKAHRASTHNKNLSKAQSREVRTIELDFQLSRRRPGSNRADDFDESGESRSFQGGRGRGGDRYSRRRDRDLEDIDLQRAIEASKESANTESAPAVKERVPDPVNDFPALNGAVVPVTVPSQPKPVRSTEDDFPTLSAAKGSKQQTQPPAVAYSSVMNRQFDPKPIVPVQKESKPVLLGTITRVHRDRPSVAPKKTEDEYPALGGGAPASRNLVPNASSVNWMKKSVNNVANSGITDTKNKNNKAKNSKNVETLVKDENEFPSLGLGGQGKNTGIFAHSLSDWTKQNSSSGKKKSKEDKNIDKSFELPESYYKSYEEPLSDEKTVTVVKTLANAAAVLDHPAKPAPLNNVKEFPGLPVRARQAKAKEDNKIKNKSKQGNKVKTKSSDTNACLGEIALTLMQAEKDGSGSSFSKVNQIDSSNQPAKLLDWFDNPQDLSEISEPVFTESASDANLELKDVTLSQTVDCSSFPSLHSMSISVQQPKPPPGFTSNLQLHGSSAISAPPGFENQPPPLLSAPAQPPGFSTSAVYIQPANFRDRNMQLIENIREALVTAEDGFSNFKVLSGQFRQGLMDASDYYISCLALMGDDDFFRVFPELLALLPDISKQRELLEVHQANTGKKSAAINSQKMSVCQVCGQVMVAQDVQHHQLQHTELNDFPLLSDSMKSKVPGSNNVGPDMLVKEVWIKAK